VNAIHRVHDENSSIGVPGVRERPKVERHVPARTPGNDVSNDHVGRAKKGTCTDGSKSTVARTGRYLPGCWLPWRYDKFVIANLYNWHGAAWCARRPAI